MGLGLAQCGPWKMLVPVIDPYCNVGHLRALPAKLKMGYHHLYSCRKIHCIHADDEVNITHSITVGRDPYWWPVGMMKSVSEEWLDIVLKRPYNCLEFPLNL